MTRRKFNQLLTLAASLLLLPGLQCNQQTSDLLTSLRGIVKSVETALAALALLGGLLPDVVSDTAKYLLAVLKFVDDVASLLEDEAKSALDKANQILQWAAVAALQVPQVPAPVAAILNAVAAALDAFLSHFGANQANAARTRGANVPDLKLSSNDKTLLVAIEAQATADSLKVEEWAEAHGAKAKLGEMKQKKLYSEPRLTIYG